MGFRFDQAAFREAVLELVRLASTDLGKDVVAAIELSARAEAADSPARNVLEQILRNISLAAEQSTPICQDTGTCLFLVDLPPAVSMRAVEHEIGAAVAEATARSWLRPNAVEPLSGINSGSNLGHMAPQVHFREWDRAAVRAALILKGGGSENVSAQYKLPDAGLGAGRDLDGVYKCVVDAVNRAQGKGCAPGILGVGIGGDRAGGMLLAKEQLLRALDDASPEPGLARLEQRLLQDLNSLGVGPMGFGGKTTVLGVKLGQAHRHPACYFVSISYMCWAARRKTMIFAGNGVEYA